MPTHTHQTSVVNPSRLFLEVHAPDGSVRRKDLECGNVLIVGSSPACGLRLESPQIAGMHCTIEFKEDGITIRDWDTEPGTYLDGRRIEEEHVDLDEFELEVAGFRIHSRLIAQGDGQSGSRSPRHPAETSGSAPASHSSGQREAPSVDYNSPGWLVAELEREEGRFVRHHDNVQVLANEDAPAAAQDVPQSADPIDSTPPEVDDPWDNPGKATSARRSPPPVRVPEGYHKNAFLDDATELLQVEIDVLRSELAERDARLQELEELVARDADHSPPNEEAVSPQEVEKLVARLENLLEELEQSDARIATLNEALRMSEDAVHAADEERQQLEAWLGEIDRRVGQWEQEWHAERECLNRSIAELTEQRDRAEQQLAAGATIGPQGHAAEQLIQQLRTQYTELQAAYQELEQEKNRLLVRVEVGEIADVEGQVRLAVDEALREERLQLAQEKASLARERSVLLKQQAELQDLLQRKAQSADSADHRIRAFREHLREIHESEPHLKQGPSLSKRLGKLWRKLEGRPLDTD